jgi:aminoglycoside/choline kinase family phosphotransferase
MVMPPEASKKSEEASKGEPPKELPFVNVHRYLEKLGIRVPRILRYDEPAGMMVLEDLSDVTFEQALEGGKNNQALYTRAVDLLARLRVEAERRPDPDCLAFTRAFDEDLYDWELHHFREWGLEAWSGKKPTDAERAELDTTFRDIARQLAAAPRGFTHRDYQSRNIMVKDGELVVIDFQDALQGPRQYDLVALLRDSYVELDRGFVGHDARPVHRHLLPAHWRAHRREGLQGLLRPAHHPAQAQGRWAASSSSTASRATRASWCPSPPRCATCATASRAARS